MPEVMGEDWTPIRFIDAEVEVDFSHPPLHSKTPDAPDAFVWQGARYQVRETLSSWVDFRRRGRMVRNMQPAHQAVAFRRGSWGVGRFFFRVRTEQGGVFDLYYDRAPEAAADRAGHWFLWRELRAAGDDEARPE
jgi:hypothetical protein